MNSFEPKKNPKQERAKNTVDSILESVVKLVDQGDSEVLTTTRIAEKAGVSVGSLYQYFPSKEAIFSALIEFYFRKEFGLIRDALADQKGSTLDQAVDSMVSRIVEIRKKNLGLERALMQFFSRSGNLEFLNDLDRRLIEQIDGALIEGAARGVVRRTETTAFVLLHTVRSIFLATTLQRPELYGQIEDLRNNIKRAILGIVSP